MDFLLGWLSGFTGALPFVHTNLILALLPAAPAFAVSLAFSHLAFELFPLVFFGVPSASHGVSYLPAHQLSQKGEGEKAFFLARAGLVAGLFFALILSPLFVFFWPTLFSFTKPHIGLLLTVVVALAVALDKFRKHALLVFLGSGLLGAKVFSLPLNEPLFPLLSGLFGVPSVLLAGGLADSEKSAPARWHLKHAFAGGVLGGFSVLLPALSPSFLASFAFLFYERSLETFLVLSSAIASSKLFFDLLASAVIEKARSAPAAVLLEHGASLSDALPLALCGVLAFAASIVLASAALPLLAKLFRKPIPPALFLAFLAGGVFLTSGPLGLFVLAWASAWSTACLSLKSQRKYLLGALMVPAITYSFGLSL